VRWIGVSAVLDARPGGVFQLDPNHRDVYGEFVEDVPFRRVVFTWGRKEPNHPIPAGSSRVEIDLVMAHYCGYSIMAWRCRCTSGTTTVEAIISGVCKL
jgi:uncharacterized protein YndB with AHSA1/START domain